MRHFLVLLTLLSGFVKAQDAPQQPLVRANTRVVLLDVVAVDKAGKPVRTLKQNDFTVLENGVAQKIASFEGPVAGSAAEALPNSPRTIILLDELNIAFTDLSYARDRTIQFLAEKQWQHNPTAILAVDLHGLVKIQDYTQDEALLKEKMKQFHPSLNNPVEGVVDADKMAEHAEQAINALLEIARASVGSSYNLNVIWVTSGFSGSIRDTKSKDGRQNGMRRLANLLMTARMRLYTIDPGGSKPLGANAVATPINSTPLNGKVFQGQSTRDSMMEEEAGQNTTYDSNQLLSILTGMTGGRAYYGRNDVDIALGQAEEDGGSNYSLSYTPANGDFHGEYRKIEIRTNNPDVSVRTRLGYYANDDDAASQSADLREAKWKAALTSPLAYTAFHVTCPMKYDAATSHAAGTITVKPTPLVIASPQQTQQIVRAASLSKNGDIVEGWQWQIEGKQTWTNRVTNLKFDKAMPKKATSVRFLISDPAAEHIGTCDFVLP